MRLTAPDVIVGAVALAVCAWALGFCGCGAPPLPPEPAIICTVTAPRDAGHE
jgi:hypothetical protein